MKRPSKKTLFVLTSILLTLAALDVVLTSVGILFFHGEEGNPLIVAMAECLPWGSEDDKVVTTVWLMKIVLIALMLLAVHQVVKSKPVRDDIVMFFGLLISVLVYVGVVASWGYYFYLVGIS